MKIRSVHSTDSLSESEVEERIHAEENNTSTPNDAFSIEEHLKQISKSTIKEMEKSDRQEPLKDSGFAHIDVVLNYEGLKRLKAKWIIP